MTPSLDDQFSDARDAAPNDSIEGFGTPPTQPLRSLPPIEPSIGNHRLSRRTGEPRRTVPVTIATVLFTCSSAFSLCCYWIYWWRAIHIATFPTSSQLIAWADPRPGSLLSVVCVCAMAILAVIWAAGSGTAAYSLWQGAACARWIRFVAVLTSAISILFFPAGYATVALCTLAALISLLPGTRAYLRAWALFYDPEKPEVQPFRDVRYGPAPRFQPPETVQADT